MTYLDNTGDTFMHGWGIWNVDYVYSGGTECFGMCISQCGLIRNDLKILNALYFGMICWINLKCFECPKYL